MPNTHQMKQEIILALDILPVEGLNLLFEFMTFLRLKFGLGQKSMSESTGLEIDQDPNEPNAITRQALAEAKARYNLSNFNSPEDLKEYSH